MRVNVVSPWYPDYASRYSGIFVRQQVEALRSAGLSVNVEVPTIFPAPPGPIPEAIVTSMRLLASTQPNAMFHSEGSTTWIPTPVPSRSGFYGRTLAMSESLLRKREVKPVEADVHHAHLGVPTGAALLRIGDGPLVVTEHQSTLQRIFNDRRARREYRRTIDLADRFFCVSIALRDQIAMALGADAANQIDIMPNIVDLSDIRFVKQEDFGFHRWIYVGTVAAHKGIETLLKTYSNYLKHTNPNATLTIVGDGPHTAWVARYVESNGLNSSVRLLGSKPRREIGPLLNEADTMVHLSPSETFGIAYLEGIGAGLPVISIRNGGSESSWGSMELECGLQIDDGVPPAEIAARIAQLADNPSRLDLVAGRSMIEANYSPGVIAKRLIGVYKEITR